MNRKEGEVLASLARGAGSPEYKVGDKVWIMVSTPTGMVEDERGEVVSVGKKFVTLAMRQYSGDDRIKRITPQCLSHVDDVWAKIVVKAQT